MDYFSNFDELSQYLDRLGIFRMQPGLERIHDVLDYLDLLRPPYAVVQVVGTNGKGSTASFLAYLAQAHGLKAGLHTSPHFVSFSERLRIFQGDAFPGGEGLGCKQILDAANKVMQASTACEVELTWFELITAIAVQAFATAKVEIAIMESGLGGSFDATTALEADYVVFTPIELDHCNILGDTISAIARDKAGAVRAGSPVITSAQHPDAMQEIETAISLKNAELYVLPHGISECKSILPSRIRNLESRMRLGGGYQFCNAALALTAWRIIREKERLCVGFSELELSIVEQNALTEAWIPGRMQRISARAGYPFSHPPLLLDGAHNVHGMRALVQRINEEGLYPAAIIFSCLADKNPEELVKILLSLPDCMIFVPPIKDNPRAMPPEELAQLIGARCEIARNMEEALQRAINHIFRHKPELFVCDEDREIAGDYFKSDITGHMDLIDAPVNELANESPKASCLRNPLLICGSLYLLGEFFVLAKEYLD